MPLLSPASFALPHQHYRCASSSLPALRLSGVGCVRPPPRTNSGDACTAKYTHHQVLVTTRPGRNFAGVATHQPRLSVRASAADAAAVAAQPEQPKNGLDVAKIVSLGTMFLCSCFNYTLLQNLKDSLIVTSAGAEVLPFLGSYGVLPGSILFYIYHDKISRVLPEKYVYYASIFPFLAFYILFAFVVYPMAPMLHPTHLLESWKAMLPGGLVGLASMGVYWTFSLFFVVAELWGGVAISMLFWGLADDVCSMQEAKDIYPALGMIANVGLIIAGACSKFINKVAEGSDLVALRLTVGTVVAVGGVLLLAKRFVDDKYMEAAHATAAAEAEKKKKKKREISDEGGADASGLAKAFNVLKQSPKVGNLAVLVTAYFIVQKLFDFAWKAQLRLFYPTNSGYQAALADVSQMTGIATIVLMALSRFAFEHLGWKGTALISPVAIGVTGTVFFAAALGAANPGLMGPQLAALIIPLGALAGVLGRVISKSSKYSLFDPAKEMVYITMNRQEKTEGKAAVDLLASYFGKSGASLLTQALVLVFGTLNRSMPFIAVSHLVVCIAWTKSTLSLAELMKGADTMRASSAPAPESASEPNAAAAAPTANGSTAAAPAVQGPTSYVPSIPGGLRNASTIVGAVPTAPNPENDGTGAPSSAQVSSSTRVNIIAPGSVGKVPRPSMLTVSSPLKDVAEDKEALKSMPGDD